MTTVSVVMATYQGGRFLPEQLRSLSAQSRLPDEVVVCDDGSTDDTLDQVRDFAAGAPFPVHLHQNPRRVGVAANFSRAISLASGSVVALSDQDDVWMPDKLARQLSILEARPAVGAVFGDATLVDAGLRPLDTGLFDSIRFSPARQRRLEHGQATEVILAWPVVCGATLAFRSSFRKLLLPIPGSGLHDVWLSVLLSAVADLAVVREPLILSLIHI